MRDKPELEHQKTIQAGSKSFYFASLFFPADLQQSAYRVYAWCRYCDDEIDRDFSNSAEAAWKTLENLQTQTVGALEKNQDVPDPFSALGAACKRHEIPSQYPLDLLEGMRMDLTLNRYPTIKDLEKYCYHVAGTVGLMMAHVMGVKSWNALQNACDMGIAMQLTNISRDVGDDEALGRVYLPEAWLKEAGVDLSKPLLSTDENRTRTTQVVRRILLRAEEMYRSGERGIVHLPLRAAFAIAAAASIYREIGREVLRRGPRAWDTRVYIPTRRKAWLALVAVLKVLALAPTRIFQKKERPALDRIWRYT